MSVAAQTPPATRSGHVAIGVDTHKHIHVTAVLDPVGGILEALTIPIEATSFGRFIAFDIEGTGSHVVALTPCVRWVGHKVGKVNRLDCRWRPMDGKSDTLDAENAARAVLAGHATAVPKSADGSVEMLRQLKIVHQTAVKARAATMVTLRGHFIMR